MSLTQLIARLEEMNDREALRAFMNAYKDKDTYAARRISDKQAKHAKREALKKGKKR